MHESRQRRGLTSTHKFIDRVFLSRQFIENTNQLLGYPHLENNFSFIALQSRYINYVIWFSVFFKYVAACIFTKTAYLLKFLIKIYYLN